VLDVFERCVWQIKVVVQMTWLHGQPHGAHLLAPAPHLDEKTKLAEKIAKRRKTIP